MEGKVNTLNIKHKDGSSKFKGACWDKTRNKWSARGMIAGKQYNLGRFENEIDAAKAYNSCVLKYGGHTALLNNV